jgi:hypothetical protein
MAKFLNTESAYAQIVEIVSKAQGKLVLITPFVKMPPPLLERIRDKALHNIKVVIVCREEDLRLEEKTSLNQIRNLELRFLEKLHAKCFYNENTMVITSLNLYETSSQNREMGILLTLTDDSVVFKEAQEEAEFIIRLAILDRASNIQQINAPIRRVAERENVAFPNKNSKQQSKSLFKQAASVIGSLISSDNGHCIRCSVELPFDMGKPYCSSCFKKAKYDISEKRVPVESFCLSCGKDNESSIDKPLCYSCYKKLNK